MFCCGDFRNIVIHDFAALNQRSAEIRFAGVTRSAGIYLCQLPGTFIKVKIRPGNSFPILIVVAAYKVNMRLPGAVTTFTTYVDHTKRCIVTIRINIIIFLQVGRMTGSTHSVPVLSIPDPVQPIMRCDLLAGILVKPFLCRVSELTRGTCIRPPGNSTRYCCSGVNPNVYLTS